MELKEKSALEEDVNRLKASLDKAEEVRILHQSHLKRSAINKNEAVLVMGMQNITSLNFI